MYAQKITRVYIVDDHQMVIDGLLSLLQSTDSVTVVGFTDRPLLVLDELKRIPTDLLITDISMPLLNGIALTRLVKAQFPNIKIMCLSMYADTISINEMKDAGADGYIFKNTGKQQLIDALDCIALNGTYFSEALNNDINPQNEDVTNEKLTSREIEVLKLIEKEYNNKQISNELFISQRTVETHRKNIFRKTNTQNVIGLLKYAYNHHII